MSVGGLGGFGLSTSPLIKMESPSTSPTDSLIPTPHMLDGSVKGFSVATEERVELKGRRLGLRPLTPADFESWTEARSRSEDRLAAASGDTIALDAQKSADAFEGAWMVSETARRQGTDFHFGIFLDDELVGEAFLSGVQRGPLQSAFFGKWIATGHTRQGYSAEAFVLLCRFAFEELELHRIEFPVDVNNERMREVLDELGIRNEGLAPGYIRVGDTWHDQYRYAITQDDWQIERDRLVKEWIED